MTKPDANKKAKAKATPKRPGARKGLHPAAGLALLARARRRGRRG